MKKIRCCYIILLVVLVACSFNKESSETADQPKVQPIDLLITVNDLPKGWESVKPFKSTDNLCSVDCISVQFIPEDGLVTAAENIYVFRTIDEAKENYENQVLPEAIGNTPADWDYSSKVADQSVLNCYTYYDSTNQTKCEWIGRYSNYIVDFTSYIVPGKISLDDLKRVVHRIDEKMQKVKAKPLS